MIHKAFVRTGGLLLGLLLVLGLLSACGSGSSPDYYQPVGYGPTFNGVRYCGYLATPLECAGEPGVPYQMGTVAPVGYYSGMSSATDIATAMFLWHLSYHSWYSSPNYYNHYVPTQYRTVYVKQYVAPFDSKYSSAEKSAESRATYKSSKSGKTVPGNKVNTNKFTPPKNNGGSGSKTKNCGSLGDGTTPVGITVDPANYRTSDSQGGTIVLARSSNSPRSSSPKSTSPKGGGRNGTKSGC